MQDADLTIHTGDFCSNDVLALFEAHGPVLAARGNNDDPDLQAAIPEKLELRAIETRFLVTHGHRESGSSAKVAVQRAYAGRVNLVIFGHSHRPCWEEVEGTWFLNPGSPTMKRREPQFSFATLDVNQDGTFNVLFTYF